MKIISRSFSVLWLLAFEIITGTCSINTLYQPTNQGVNWMNTMNTTPNSKKKNTLFLPPKNLHLRHFLEVLCHHCWSWEAWESASSHAWPNQLAGSSHNLDTWLTMVSTVSPLRRVDLLINGGCNPLPLFVCYPENPGPKVAILRPSIGGSKPWFLG